MNTNMKCITCQTYEVNPMITGTDGPDGKSFCSRICRNLWVYSYWQFILPEDLKRIALKRHEESNATNIR